MNSDATIRAAARAPERGLPGPLRWALGLRSPAGDRARLSILIFHRVRPQTDTLLPHELDARQFDRICGWVSRWFQVLPLDEAAKALRQGRMPARALSITFDDGYADNQTVALPILRRHGLPATVFVATGFLDGGRMWNDTLIEAIRRARRTEIDLREVLGGESIEVDLGGLEARRRAIDRVIMAMKYRPHTERFVAAEAFARAVHAELPADLMMSGEQLRAWSAAGMGVGAHTVTHPILAGLPRQRQREEIGASRETLRALVAGPIPLFAYPNGKPGVDFDDTSVEVVRELGFEAAVTTVAGAAARDGDPYRLPRFAPWDRNRLRFGLRMLGNLA